MLAMKKIVLAVSLIAAVTTVEGRNPLHGPPYSNETNSDGPDSIHGHHKVFEMSNPNSLNEDELYQLADFKTHKMIADVDFLRQIEYVSTKEECKKKWDGICIENGGYCFERILLLHYSLTDHCCCCCGVHVNTTTPVTTPVTIPVTTTPVTTPVTIPVTTAPVTTPGPGCCDECERMEGICINNNGHCDGIIKIMEVDNEHCCCCIKQDTICPEPFEEIGGCCYYFNSTRVSWVDAELDCQRRGENVHLAEVGRDECNDVLVMEAVARKGASRNWFGALSDEFGAIWFWPRTGREFSKHSNMWWWSMPDSIFGKCVMAMNVDAGPELRAYFGVNKCDTLFGYTCQIFGIINNI